MPIAKALIDVHGRQAAEAPAAATPDFAEQAEQEAAAMPRAGLSGSAANEGTGLHLLRAEQTGNERADGDAPAAKRPGERGESLHHAFWGSRVVLAA